jgi:3'-phosphoadenosine 5'-phosphosulfate sulfotransferase (PAPS reductase)/FAD synthetase
MERARQIIKEALSRAEHPAVLSSFGKDSVLLLKLVHEVRPDAEVIWFRSGLTPEQGRFAKAQILAQDLSVWSWLPSDAYVLPNGEGLTLVREQAFGPHRLPVLMDVEDGERCVFDFPKERTLELYPHFDVLLMGYKDSDSHEVLGGSGFCPADGWPLGEAKVYAPLRHMTDTDVWAAIKSLGVAYDEKRYDEGGADPDTYRACSECLKEGESATVYCPKTGERIPRQNWHGQQRLKEFQSRFGFKRKAA